MFGEFAVGDEWFTAMDSPAPHAFDYNEGLSLLIECEDQAEIDRLLGAIVDACPRPRPAAGARTGSG